MLFVKVPAINGLGRTKGCERAPEAIIKALDEIWSNESGKEINIKNFKIEEIKINNSDIKESNKTLYNEAKKIFEENKKNKKIIFLGGDHSITYSLFLAFKKKFQNKSLGILIFDAHADCVNNFKPPTNEDWLRVLIEEGFPATNVILVGARNVFRNKQERDFLKRINIFSCKELFEDFKGSCNLIIDRKSVV